MNFKALVLLTLLLAQPFLPFAVALSLGWFTGKQASNTTQQKKDANDSSLLNPVNVKETVQTFPSQNPPGSADAVLSLQPPPPQQDGKYLDSEVFKSLLKDLLSRLDSYSSVAGSGNSNPRTLPISQLNERSSRLMKTGALGGGINEGPRHVNALNVHHCSLHGLWLSTVAGAAIELIPEQHYGHIEIRTKIFELPDNPYPPMITSQWTGKGIISQESPTTITIVFQEHIEGPPESNTKVKEKKPRAAAKEESQSVDIQLPRTAVFVGQCLVCFGNAMLQGTWVVFPSTQTCTMSPTFSSKQKRGLPPTNGQPLFDAMYVLQYY